MRGTKFSTTFRLLIVGKFVLNTATRFVYAFLPAIARGLGVSLSAAGWLTSVRWGVGAALPAVVRVVGREHRRRVVFAGLGLFTAGSLITAATGAYVGAMVGFVMMGLGKPLYDTGSQAVIADRVPYESRARYLGLMETMWAASFLVGAPIAGWLIGQAGWTSPFWVAVLAVVVVAVMLGRISFDAADNAASLPGRTGFRWDSRVIGFLVSTALIVGSAEMVFVTFAAWLEESHGFSIANLAALATTIGVAELAAEGAVVAATDRLGKRRSVMLGLVVAAAGYILLGVSGSSIAIGIGALVIGIAGFEFAFVSSISVGTELRPDARIQLLSRFVVAQAAGRALAALGGIALYAAFGIGAVGTAAGIAAAAAGLVVMRFYRSDVGQQQPA